MSAIFHQIRDAVGMERFIVGSHADERVRERGFAVWQVAAGIAEGEVIREVADARPNGKVEVRQFLSDGTPYMAVWSWLKEERVAKLVTVHFFDRGLARW